MLLLILHKVNKKALCEHQVHVLVSSTSNETVCQIFMQTGTGVLSKVYQMSELSENQLSHILIQGICPYLYPSCHISSSPQNAAAVVSFVKTGAVRVIIYQKT
jgi:hypothetical protein